jgi:hypothetical protein
MNHTDNIQGLNTDSNEFYFGILSGRDEDASWPVEEAEDEDVEKIERIIRESAQFI